MSSWQEKVTLGKIKKLHDKFIKVDSGCWEHTYSVSSRNGHKYARVSLGRKNKKYMHQLFYYIYNGDYDDSLYICHKCDNQLCVNPSHLYAGTPADNVRDLKERGYNSGWDKTHCINGHEFTAKNTYIRTVRGYPQRNCRKCMYQRTKVWRSKKRAHGKS